MTFRELFTNESMNPPTDDSATEPDDAMKGELETNEMRAGLPILAFADPPAFDAWLASQGSIAPGLWLRLAKKGAAERTLTKSEAIDAALCHGWIDGQLNTYDDHFWLIRFTPRKPRSKWSELNRRRATELLAGAPDACRRPRPDRDGQIGRPLGCGLCPSQRRQGAARPCRCARRQPKAAAFFATLTGANRYAILYRIGAVKTPVARARKITRFVAMLERGETIHG